MAEGSSKDYPTGSGDGWKSALDDPDVVEVPAEEAAGWSFSGRQKRKLTEVVPSDIIELDADDGPDEVMIIDEKIENHKNKQVIVDMDWPEHAKSGDFSFSAGQLQSDMSADFAVPTAVPIGPWDGLGGYPNNFSGSSVIPVAKVVPLDDLGGYPDNVAIPNAIPITKTGTWNVLGGYHNKISGPSAIPITKFGLWGSGPGGYHNNAVSPGAIPVTKVGPWDAMGGYHNSVTGSSAIPATNFYPWNGPMLAENYHNHFVVAPAEKHKYDSNSTPLMESGRSFNSGANNHVDISPGVEAVLPQGTSAEMPHQASQTDIVNSEVHEKYKTFKQFDTATDHSDNFYALQVRAVKKPSKAWVKRIQHEWKVLENNLPDTIYVRVYEDRMDLLRAVIVGPAGTPYHDGLFFFDVYFPSRYPSKPPLVSYHSGGLRLNPNLYECGKVCLSLLNTWAGAACERWNPSNSTMLQVLVSIQALVLNAKPYFNEPGHAITMQYSLRNPPKNFEDFIVGHFCNYGSKILRECKSYMAGAQVGCLVGDGVQDVDVGDKSCSTHFKASLNVLFADLLKEFAKIGVNCDEFQNPEAAKGTEDTTLDLKL
ncbi:unnamed protein product [Urochloa humidicola]